MATAVPIHVSFDADKVKALKDEIQRAYVPPNPLLSSKPGDLGIDVGLLASLKDDFVQRWSYDALQKRINTYPNYLVTFNDISGFDPLSIHFVHAKSTRSDAIPLLLLHGWPGTFFDFHKVIDPLVNPPAGVPAFHVVIPSLPGFFLSSHPTNVGWTILHTARVMNRLMFDVLGYKKYGGQGGDWGSYILRLIGSLYPEEAPVLHFNMFRCPAPKDEDENTLSPAEQNLMNRRATFAKTGAGYLDIQSTKPFTIGLAIASSPFATLIYIGEKFYSWSDPEKLDPMDLLDTVALYHLSGSFSTSVLIYHQSAELRSELVMDTEKWRIKSKIGYTNFPYEIGGAPRSYISAAAPLVFYNERTSGGHFAALDNPTGLVEDLQSLFGQNW
ncbi:alpha/beta-hydrolase [Rickenella mellea]|uniref:Alpha/beta-hydrolase n=1 Tax=Rickenella mellea TaxID=50990 RepID=A0A4Y7PZE5_9AGAM|nr:alpha/beta-hydrolase [Rickenella mellea]